MRETFLIHSWCSVRFIQGNIYSAGLKLDCDRPAVSGVTAWTTQPSGSMLPPLGPEHVFDSRPLNGSINRLFSNQENENRREQEKKRKKQEEERKRKGDTGSKISESNSEIPP